MLKSEIAEISCTILKKGSTLFSVRCSNSGEFYRVGNLQNQTLSIPIVVEHHKIGKELFQPFCAEIPDEFTRLNPMSYKVNPDEMEYILMFHGGKKNSEGKYELVNGIGISNQPDSGYKHPLMPMLEKIFYKLEELSNPIYFEGILSQVFECNTAIFSKKIIPTVALGFTEKQEMLTKFLNDVNSRGQMRRLREHIHNLKFTNQSGHHFQAAISHKNGIYSAFLNPVKHEEIQHRTEKKQGKIKQEQKKQSRFDKVIGFLISMKVVFFILMLVLIIYLTFYL